MKHIKTLIIICIATVGIQAQQINVPSFYFQEAYFLNAGAAGMAGSLQSTVLGDFQWLDFEDAPSVQNFSVHMPFKEKHGLGIKFESDNVGPVNQVKGQLSYAYQLRFKEEMKLSIGIDAGVFYQGLDWGALNARDETDPNVAPTDEKEASYVPEVNLGFYFTGKGYAAGLAVNRLTRSKYGYSANNISLDARQKIHTYLHGYYEIPVMEKVTFIPSALISIAEGAPLYLTAMASVDLNNVLRLHTGFKSGKDWMVGANININTIKIGYLYEQSNTEIQSITGNSHEIFIQYTIGPKG